MLQPKALRKILQTTALAAMAAGLVTAGEYHFKPEHRRPADQTLSDLQQIQASHHFSGEENDRFNNVEHHLKQFIDGLHDGGYFEEGKLDQIIEDLHGVLDKNPMPHEAHEELERDWHDLRVLRDHHE